MSPVNYPPVYITGGTGFIGANLVAGFNDFRIRPTIMRRKSSSLVALEGLDYQDREGDILDDVEVLARELEGIGWVFHTAAVSDYWRKGKDLLYQVNVQGTKNIVKACQMAGVERLIFTSSLAAFGLPGEDEIVDESLSFNIQPDQFPYAHSKHLAETAILEAVEQGLNALILNPTIVFGPRDVNQISSSIITEASRGLVRFNLPGGGNFVAVEDVVEGHIAAAEKGLKGEKYILAGENLTNKEAGRIIFEVLGRRQPRIDVPVWCLGPASTAVDIARLFLGNRVPMDGNQVRLSGVRIFANGQKARDAFNLQRTPFRTMVERTYRWYLDNGYISKTKS